MDTFLTISLGLSTLVLGIVAIGGETWNNEQQNFLARITRRGWIAVVFLAVTFCLTIVKELQATQDQKELAKSQKTIEDKTAEIALATRDVSDLQQKNMELNQNLANTIESKTAIIEEKTETVVALQDENLILNRRLGELMRQTQDELLRRPRPIHSTGITLRGHLTEIGFFVCAEDEIRYSVLNTGQLHDNEVFQPNERAMLLLQAGSNRYQLSETQGAIPIFGSRGTSMPLSIIKQNGPPGIAVKLSLHTTRENVLTPCD